MELLAPLSDALAGTAWIAALASLGWGFASIWMSPCHFAGVPLVGGCGYSARTPFRCKCGSMSPSETIRR